MAEKREGMQRSMNEAKRKHSIWREYWREFLIVLIGLAAANAIFISRAFGSRQRSTPEQLASLDPL